ncbi:MAG: type II/IV secretion system protein [Lentisphaeria bacterium]|nr:type II/IV secretion system protein [Lentisphaeria bacterium]
MEFNPVTLALLLAWLFYGMRQLDESAVVPAGWQRKGGGTVRPRNFEWVILFFGPAVLVFDKLREFWSTHLRFFWRDARRKLKYADLSFVDARGNQMYGNECNNPAIDELKDIILEALKKRASDIFLDPVAGNDISLRFRIDGALVQIKTLDPEFGDNVVNAIKVAAGMDITEKRRPQDGSFSTCHEDSVVAFRVATVGAFGGEKVALRLLGSENAPRTLEAIGFAPEQLDIMKRSVSLPSGMILMCGNTGSGKTTTLYALIGAIDYSLKNVISIEDPVERVLPNVSQMEVNAKAGITFASLLRNALRQNPDVICLGEIRDEETAGIAVNAAQTGHLIISTVHSNDAVDTIDRLANLGVPLRSLAATVRVIVNQRLARRLCGHCKKPLGELPEKWRDHFARNGIDPSGVCRPVGCPECSGTGYQGRFAFLDILVIDNDIREELEKEDASLLRIKQLAEAKDAAGSPLCRGAALAAAGVTSLEEIERITMTLDGGGL